MRRLSDEELVHALRVADEYPDGIVPALTAQLQRVGTAVRCPACKRAACSAPDGMELHSVVRFEFKSEAFVRRKHIGWMAKCVCGEVYVVTKTAVALVADLVTASAAAPPVKGERRTRALGEREAMQFTEAQLEQLDHLMGLDGEPGLSSGRDL